MLVHLSVKDKSTPPGREEGKIVNEEVGWMKTRRWRVQDLRCGIDFGWTSLAASVRGWVFTHMPFVLSTTGPGLLQAPAALQSHSPSGAGSLALCLDF